jgi:Uma2 family endonuclease
MTGNSGLFSYPDLTVVCVQPAFLDSHTDVLLNPRVIFEVLSPNTEAYDRGEKFLRYRNYIATLTDYIMVSQTRPLVEHYVQRPDGQWLYFLFEGLSADITIDSIQCHLDLSEIYARVEFPDLVAPHIEDT